MAIIRITPKELLLLIECLEYSEEAWGGPSGQQVRQLRDDIKLRFIQGDSGKDWKEFKRLVMYQ